MFTCLHHVYPSRFGQSGIWIFDVQIYNLAHHRLNKLKQIKNNPKLLAITKYKLENVHTAKTRYVEVEENDKINSTHQNFDTT